MEERIDEKMFDFLFNAAALSLYEKLVPVEGEDGIFFPATYAPLEDGSFKGGYNIDDFGGGENLCRVDSVGSQANRIETIFKEEKYRDLVPQIIINAGSKKINLLDVGHRAGDALVRFSELSEELTSAFLDYENGDATKMAKISPTTIVFGAWDSRNSAIKITRIFCSEILAENVKKLTRSAIYAPAIDYSKEGLLDGISDREKSEEGFNHVPSSKAHGGVIAKGEIYRNVVIHLNYLDSKIKDVKLKRYVLGLSLVAFLHPINGFLRSGCNLVVEGRDMSLVSNGSRKNIDLTDVLEYAKLVAKDFGVGESREVNFQVSKVSEKLKKNKEKKEKKNKKEAE